MSGYLEEVQREQRQRRNAIAGSRAPLILLPALPWDAASNFPWDVASKEGANTYTVLVDTAVIRTIGPHGIGSVIGLAPPGGLYFTPLTVVALAALLAEHGVVIIDATEVRG